MSKHTFEGRVAVVTGAGRGIGRAHARLLGERGASVVVNDLGGTKEGVGSDPEPARTVASEIVDAGGKAIPDTSDVSTVAGGQALIDAAVKEFGRIDIVINNAGIVIWAGPPEVDAAIIEANLAVHVLGSFNTIRAAWPHMVEQDFGRIVLTTSTGMFGLPDNLGYAIGKSALIGMSRSLTVAAGANNIKINLLAPAAWTRMGAHPSDPDAATRPAPEGMEPERVAPMAAFLAHEDCNVSGEIYAAGAGRFTRIFIAETKGHTHRGSDWPTIEDVSENWATINEESGYYIPTDLMDWSAHFMARG